jgi:hypothetical protein
VRYEVQGLSLSLYGAVSCDMGIPLFTVQGLSLSLYGAVSCDMGIPLDGMDETKSAQFFTMTTREEAALIQADIRAHFGEVWKETVFTFGTTYETGELTVVIRVPLQSVKRCTQVVDKRYNGKVRVTALACKRVNGDLSLTRKWWWC